MTRLKDRIAVVTGAASGIGQAVARRFADEGATVMLLDLQADALATVADTLPEAQSYPVDVTDSAAVGQTINKIVEARGQVDVLFSGVGGSGRRWGDGPAHECTEEGWQRTLDLNLTSMFYVCKHTLTAMLANPNGGTVITLASVLGMVGGDDDFSTHAYAASKSGIIGFTRAMASYYARHHIRVNAIAPGLIATPMSQRAQADPHILNRLTELQPLTGAMGQPEDIAGAAAYLASDDARFVTGTVLTVDGGWTMR